MSCRCTTSKPSLVIPGSPRTKLKTPTSSTAGAVKHAPVESNRKQVKPRQSGVFKRFTVYIIDFFKKKFVWAKKKSVVVSADAEHDKRIAENYVFDKVLGIYVSRAEYERRPRFNSDSYSPIPDEIRRFPSRPKPSTQHEVDRDYVPKIPINEKLSGPKLKPPSMK